MAVLSIIPKKVFLSNILSLREKARARAPRLAGKNLKKSKKLKKDVNITLIILYNTVEYE